MPDGGGADIDPDTGWAGGFTVLLGNPPWDKVEFKDKEYFSVGRAVDRRAVRSEATRTGSPSGNESIQTKASAIGQRGASVKATFHVRRRLGRVFRCARRD